MEKSSMVEIAEERIRAWPMVPTAPYHGRPGRRQYCNMVLLGGLQVYL